MERVWSPAQVVSLIIGVAFIVLGGVALLRTGVDVNLFEPTTTVAGMGYTPLLGIIEVAFGLLLIAAGAFPGASDAVVFLGVLALAFGLLLVIEPDAFNQSLAAGAGHGWFYVITGGIAALTALATPAVMRRRREAAYDRYRYEDRHADGRYDDRHGDRYEDRADGRETRRERPRFGPDDSERDRAESGTSARTQRIDLSEEERSSRTQR